MRIINDKTTRQLLFHKCYNISTTIFFKPTETRYLNAIMNDLTISKNILN